LATNCLFPLITKPIRVTDESETVIDHIFTRDLSKPIYPGMIQSEFNDHYSIYCASTLTINAKVEPHLQILIRNYKNFNVEKYLRKLDEK